MGNQGNGRKPQETTRVTHGPRGLACCGPRGRRVRRGSGTKQQHGGKDLRAEPQKEKRENGADTIAEETSKTDEERKATHSESSANLRVNTGGKKKTPIGTFW